MISPGDVALYAVLCALATMPRKELKADVLDKVNFRGFLEQEPHARELLDAFWACNYKKGLEILERWKVSLRRCAASHFVSKALRGIGGTYPFLFFPFFPFFLSFSFSAPPVTPPARHPPFLAPRPARDADHASRITAVLCAVRYGQHRAYG